MTTRAAVDRVESACLSAGGTFHQRGTDLFRSIGVCHGGQRSESLVFMYDPERGRVNLHCHAGCDFERILDTLGLASSDRYDEPRERPGYTAQVPRTPRPQPARPEPAIFEAAPPGWRPEPDPWMRCRVGDGWETHAKIAEYLYADEDSRVRFGVCRCEHKDFSQWRPDRSWRGGRHWGIREHKDGHLAATVPALPYRLPQMLAGIAKERTIWIAEGEKDVLALTAEGMAATCNAEGAGKWTDAHSAYLKDADVIVVADRDVAGRKHAEKVVASLIPVARSIEVVVARAGKDAADHLAAGHRYWEFDTIWEPRPMPTDGTFL